MQRAIDAFNEAIPFFTERITDSIIAENIESYAGFSRESLASAVQRSLYALRDDLAAGITQHYANYWRSVGHARAAHATLDDILRVWSISTEIMNNYFLEHFADSGDTRAWWFYNWQRIILSGLMGLAQVFVAAREAIISEQASQLRELSSPIIPITDDILVMPLIGMVNAPRARLILTDLLDAISRNGASVVIIDITGVPMIDTSVAHHLVQAAQAARLLGAEVVLVGMSPETAQTIVQLGVELVGLTTRADLQSGIAYALSLRGLAILPAPALAGVDG